jgi:hypothetical protein
MATFLLLRIAYGEEMNNNGKAKMFAFGMKWQQRKEEIVDINDSMYTLKIDII